MAGALLRGRVAHNLHGDRRQVARAMARYSPVLPQCLWQAGYLRYNGEREGGAAGGNGFREWE